MLIKYMSFTQAYR